MCVCVGGGGSVLSSTVPETSQWLTHLGQGVWGGGGEAGAKGRGAARCLGHSSGRGQ